MRSLRAFIIGTVLATGAMLVVPAVASAAPKTGVEHFTILTTHPNSNQQTIVATGVFGAGGTLYGSNKTPHVDEAVFPNGTFTVGHWGPSTGTGNPKTCVFHFSGHGTFALHKGYGAYVGITGKGTYVINGVYTFNHRANGSCGSTLTAAYQIIHASGTVTL